MKLVDDSKLCKGRRIYDKHSIRRAEFSDGRCPFCGIASVNLHCRAITNPAPDNVQDVPAQ